VSKEVHQAMKIVVHTRFARDALLEALGSEAGFETVAIDEAAALAAGMREARALVMPGQAYDAALAHCLRTQAPRLRLIQLLTAGYDQLQVHGVPPGVRVATAGDSWSPAVAEHAITLMLAMVKGLPAAFEAQAQRRWAQMTISPTMSTLEGRTLVIVGCGSIGREAARRAAGLGMRVIGIARSVRPIPHVDEVLEAARLDEALARADVVLVSAPSTPATRGLFDAARLAACRPGALLVNVARGNLVERDALIDALRSGRLAGAALDVTDPEPLPPDDPLWNAPNLILTPHVSGSSGPAGLRRLAAHVQANLRREADGHEPTHQVLV
jgi:phosphoglycerate dehydrogenase-like enzyme